MRRAAPPRRTRSTRPLIISLYDFTGHMVEPWRAAGYPCLIVDGQHSAGLTEDPERPGLHKLGMWIENDGETLHALHQWLKRIPANGVGAVFGFPECTDMAVSGARWFAAKLAADPECQNRAASRAKFVEVVGTMYRAPWLAENPVSVLSTLWRPADFTFNPFEYGGYLPEDDVHPEHPDLIAARDAYPKKTLIWCGNGMSMPEKRRVAVRPGKSDQYLKLGGKSLRTKNIRSATPRGFALAVYHHLQDTVK